MARTNPCQVCNQVPAAEFTLSAAAPHLSWFALADGSPQLVINVCEGCLLNAAYQRAVQLGELAARDGAVEQIAGEDSLDAVEVQEAAGPAPKRSAKPEKTELPEVSEEAEAAAHH